MKKTVLFLFLSLVMMGCKDNSRCNGSDGNEGKDPDDIAAVAKYGKCSDNIIVIDASRTDSDWKTKNEKYFCDLELTTRRENHIHDYFIVDLDKVSVLNRDLIGEWLQENTEAICYKESYEYIERQHDIPITPDLLSQISALNKGQLTFAELKTEISKISKFDDLYYNSYVQFSLQSGKVKPVLHSEFDYTKNLYSIPLLKSIIYNNRTFNDHTVFEFYDISTDSSKQIIVFGIRNESSLVLFYDISVNPFTFDFFKK